MSIFLCKYKAFHAFFLRYFQMVAGLRLYIDVNVVWMGKIDLRAG